MILNLGGFNLSDTIEFKTSKFPGGEIYFRLLSPVSEIVKIYTRLNSSDDIMRLLMASDALKRAGVKELQCVIPYIAYGRQDRKCNDGESFSLEVFSNLINSIGFTKIITYDIHSPISLDKINNLEDKKNRKLLISSIEQMNCCKINLICPDKGAISRIENNLDLLKEHNIVYCEKDRDSENTKINRMIVPKIDNDFPSLILDDICDGGATFISLATEFKRVGNKNRLHLCVSHGIFSNGFELLLEHYDKIYTGNSIHKNLSSIKGYNENVTMYNIVEDDS